jgi:PelA/Pel-15E family pectate lyase
MDVPRSLGDSLCLMDIPNPSNEVKDAVAGAHVWAKRAVLGDYVEERDNNNNKILVFSRGAETRPRFGRLYDSAPIFCDRGCTEDPSKEYNKWPGGFEMMDAERRSGYGWLGDRPERLIRRSEQSWARSHNYNVEPACLR